MRRQLLPALLMVVIFTLLTGVAYPLLVTAFAQVGFGDEADGSLIENADGEVVGSKLIGQAFSEPQYFHTRPSAVDYDGSLSSGSNLGPTNDALLTEVEQRAEAYREINGLPADAEVPVDAVTASSSGLDPHISVANARLQTPRVAGERDLEIAEVQQLVDDHTSGRALGFLGELGVNVLALNLALDQLER